MNRHSRDFRRDRTTNNYSLIKRFDWILHTDAENPVVDIRYFENGITYYNFTFESEYVNYNKIYRDTYSTKM